MVMVSIVVSWQHLAFKPNICVLAQPSRGVWGHAPPPQPEIVFRPSYIASGAFLGTVVSALGLWLLM